jgi:hypothetical protein
MTKTYETRNEALKEVLAQGYRQIHNGEYISKCGCFAAHLSQTPSGKTMLSVWER